MKTFGICIAFLWMSVMVVKCRRHHGVRESVEDLSVDKPTKELVRGGTIGIIQDKLRGIELHHQDLEKCLNTVMVMWQKQKTGLT